MSRYPFFRRLGGPQRRSGRVRTISLPPRFDPRTVQPVQTEFLCTFRDSEINNPNLCPLKNNFRELVPPAHIATLQYVQRKWTVNFSGVTLTCCVDDSDCRTQQHWARCLQHGGAGHTERAMWSATVICLPLNFPIPPLLTSRIHCVLSNPVIF